MPARDRSAPAMLCTGLFITALMAASPARAQFQGGHGSASVSYQHIDVSRHTLGNGDSQAIGQISDRAMYLDLDVGLADRWSLSLQLPFKSNRYLGSDPHDPRALPGAGSEPFVDDGRFHGGWADWRAVMRYAWRTDPVQLTPFIAYSRPSHDYPFFAESALGTRQWRWQLGLDAGSRFAAPRQNLYWHASLAHSFMQPRLGRRLSRDAASIEVGGLVTPRLGLHVQLERSMAHGGVEAPGGFFHEDGSVNPDVVLFHDALLNVRYTKASIGVNLELGERDALFADLGKTLHGDNVHLIDRAWTIGVRRRF